MTVESPAPAFPASTTEEASLPAVDDRWGALAKQLRPRLTLAVNAILRLVLKRSENPGYAEDIVSEAITAAYEKRETYDPSRAQPYTWLLQIARNRTFDFLRRHRELRSERSFDDGFDAPSGPDDGDE
jgi:RNA polymerase sigma factor (sigma-70 family)